MDRQALVEMTGAPARTVFAPDSSQLQRIYAEVAYDIRCPAEAFWGRR